jgi:ketosteroid isomerase-like protein
VSQEDLEILRAAFAAFQQGDIEGMLALCDPEIEITQPRDLVGIPENSMAMRGCAKPSLPFPGSGMTIASRSCA